jgi:hypothetical protein
MVETRQQELLQGMLTGLESMNSQPGVAAPQEEVARNRTALAERLAAAPSNDYSPAWREAIDEMGVADLLGDSLLARIETIFSVNELTPSAAHTELAPLANEVTRLQSALSQLLEGLQFLKIDSDELQAGEFEIGFLIPRPAVDDALGALATELHRLKLILGPFQEVTTGSREDPKIRSVSSSNILLLLHAAGPTTLMFAGAVDRIIAAYKNLLDIRAAYKTFEDSGVVDANALDVVKASIESVMKTAIDEITEGLIQQAEANEDIQAGRINELRIEFRTALGAIANRVDQGYTIEARAGELPAVSDDETPETGAEREQRKIVDEVSRIQPHLTFTNTLGTTILELPEGPGLQGDGAGPEA